MSYTLVEGSIFKDEEDKETVEEMVKDLNDAIYGVKNIRVKVFYRKKYRDKPDSEEYPEFTLLFNTSSISKHDIEEFEGKGWSVDEWEASWHYDATKKLDVEFEVYR